jgi:preprotein translocase subunit YajC
MLISNAYAQAAGGAGAVPSSLLQFLPLVLIGLVFYFLLLRPQQQQAKQLKATLAALRRGDKVVTGGGIIATISKVISDEELEVALTDTVKVRVLRNTVVSVLSKPEPASAAKGNDKAPVKSIAKAADAKAADAKAADAKVVEAKAAEAKPTDDSADSAT